jgi:hypothetical protein
MSGRHAGLSVGRRRSVALLSTATVLGLWFGLRAPDVTPVALPPAAVQVQPADAAAVTPVAPVAPVVPVTPVVPQPGDRPGPRGGNR